VTGEVFLPSSVLAPLLPLGPPDLLLFLFPPALLFNVALSLFAVWVASKAANLVARRMAKEPS
jgi:hypothetical protein